jgi:hypothetical protein
MKHRRLFYYAMAGLFVFFCGGCSSIEDPTSISAPLWKIQGTISSDGVSPKRVRAALVWNYAGFPSPTAPRIAHDVRINTDFPSDFTLELAKLPPKEVINHMEISRPASGTIEGIPVEVQPHDSGMCELASAELLIYEDRNANGTLDFLSYEADQPIDYVIGPKEKYEIVFNQAGKPCDTDDLIFQKGLSILQYRSTFPMTCLETGISLGMNWGSHCPREVEEGLETVLLPADKPLEITLYDDLSQQRRACSTTMLTSSAVDRTSFTFIGEVPIDEIPDDAELFCDDQGYSLTFQSTAGIEIVDGGEICGTRDGEGIIGTSSIDPDQPVPEAWPCGGSYK